MIAGVVRHLIRHEYEMPAQLLRSRGLLDDSQDGDEDAASDAGDEIPTLNGGLSPMTF